MPRGWPVALGVVIVILLVSSPVLAGTEEGTVKLEDGDSLAIAIDNTAGEELWIEYQVRVLEGPDISVWFTSEQGRRDFYDADATSFYYYPSRSVEEASYAENSWSWDEEGFFYVIINNDRNDTRGQNVTVEYTVTWETYELGGLFFFVTLIMIVIIIVVVMLVVVLVTVKRAQALAEEAREAEEARATTGEGRPEPPEPYPEWVVEASTGGYLDDDDATGWDPARDEPGD